MKRVVSFMVLLLSIAAANAETRSECLINASDAHQNCLNSHQDPPPMQEPTYYNESEWGIMSGCVSECWERLNNHEDCYVNSPGVASCFNAAIAANQAYDDYKAAKDRAASERRQCDEDYVARVNGCPNE